MITLVALAFSDDLPSLDARRAAGLTDSLSLALGALRERFALGEAHDDDIDSFPSPLFRRNDDGPFLPRDSRRFRFNDDPDAWSN